MQIIEDEKKISLNKPYVQAHTWRANLFNVAKYKAVSSFKYRNQTIDFKKKNKKMEKMQGPGKST